MKIVAILLLSFSASFLFGQGVDIKKLPIEEERVFMPDTNYTTSINDTILEGHVLEICEPQHSHHVGEGLGVLKIEGLNNAVIYFVLFTKLKTAGGIVPGQFVELKVKPYKPKDRSLNKTNGFTCIPINGFNLFMLKKSKSGGDKK